MDSKTSKQKFKEKKDTYVASQYNPTNQLLIRKERTITYSGLAWYHGNQAVKSHMPMMGQTT